MMIAFELNCGYVAFPESHEEEVAIEWGMLVTEDFWNMHMTTEAAVVNEIGLDARLNQAEEDARREAAASAAASR